MNKKVASKKTGKRADAAEFFEGEKAKVKERIRRKLTPEMRKLIHLVSMEKALLPLSGKERPDKCDMDTLKKDREALTLIVAAVMANGRLSAQITHAWVAEHGYYLVPQEWFKAK